MGDSFLQVWQKSKLFCQGGLRPAAAHAPQARTFAGREEFFPPHMSPEKMIEFSFAAPTAKLYEVF
ncbi:MAG: hypothetical protein HPZ79_05795 [Oscillospiraceae bacterium]|nr:hypothetical protein [Oscillospiraceae bacterium]